MPVVIVDGRPITVSDEEAAKFGSLKGNVVEGAGAAIDRAGATAERDYYESGGQQLTAGLEGLASGASIGLSDLLLDDEATRARARYNPGTRLATELTGAIVPALLSGGSGALAGAAKLTPTALAARAGGAAAKGLGRGLPTALAVEGAIQGAGTAASRASLNNDPLTIESVVSGAGMGALMGAGIGIMARGVQRAGTAAQRRIADDAAEKLVGENAARKIAAEKSADAAEALMLKESPALERAANSLDEISAAGKRAIADVELSMKPAVLKTRLKQLQSSAEQLSSDAMAASLSKEGVTAVKQKAMDSMYLANKNLAAAKKALEAGDAIKATALMDEYSTALQETATTLGSTIKIPAKAVQATQNMAHLAVMSKIPRNPAKWVSMSDDSAAKMFGDLRTALAPAGDALDPQRLSALTSIEEAVADAGLAVSGPGVDGAVDALEAYRDVLKQATRNIKERAISRAGRTDAPTSAPKEKTTHSFLDFVKRGAHMVGARGASHAARGAGAGIIGGAIAYQAGGGMAGLLISEMTGLRAAASEHVNQLVASMAPRASRVLRRVAPVTEILRRSVTSGLSGSDSAPGRPKKLSAREAAKERIDEITKMAPVINDVAFSVAEPVMQTSPEVAVALAAQMTKGFQHLLAATPRDPGGTHNGLKSDWVPSESQALQFASVLEAVCYPMESLDRMLQGDGDPAAAEALWAVYPSLMQETAVQLVEKLPEIQDKTDLATRGALSMAFRVPLDGLLTQQSIAALQAQFIPSIYREPGNGNVKPQSGSGPMGGRPPAVGTSNTSPSSATKTQSLQR